MRIVSSQKCLPYYREREANPEDLEYSKIQEELNVQLLEQFKEVERVIGKLGLWIERVNLLSDKLNICIVL